MEELKNAKELHYEHQTWLNDLESIRLELINLAKHSHGNLTKDIGTLLRSTVRFEKFIKKHESTIALAFRTCGIDDYTEMFPDHDRFRQKIELLKIELKDLKVLYSKYNHSAHEDLH